MIVPGISQTLRRYQGNLVMACERLYILIVKCMKILINGVNVFSLAGDHGISEIGLGVHQELMDDAEA